MSLRSRSGPGCGWAKSRSSRARASGGSACAFSAGSRRLPRRRLRSSAHRLRSLSRTPSSWRGCRPQIRGQGFQSHRYIRKHCPNSRCPIRTAASWMPISALEIARRSENAALEIRSADQEFRGRGIQLRSRPDSVRQQPGILRRVCRDRLTRWSQRRSRRKARRCSRVTGTRRIGVSENSMMRSRSASPRRSGRSGDSARARSRRPVRRWSSIRRWRRD